MSYEDIAREHGLLRFNVLKNREGSSPVSFSFSSTPLFIDYLDVVRPEKSNKPERKFINGILSLSCTE